MANIKDLKKKIKSTKSTLKITTAMKLVSAAKLARAQQNITSSRPYADELNDTIKTVSTLAEDYTHPYLTETDNEYAALLVVTSNKGLCGGYNSQLVKRVRRFLEENGKDKFKVFFIGKKGYEVLGKEVNLGELFTFDKADPSFFDLQEVGEELATLFATKEIGKVYMAYNHFKSAIAFDSRVDQVLPMALPESEKQKLEEEFPFDFKYDCDPVEMLDALIPEVLTSTLFTNMLDAIASEHGSRMAAMDSATSNCKEAIRSLTLHMNKLRQAAITTELIEVVSGAESLKG